MYYIRTPFIQEPHFWVHCSIDYLVANKKTSLVFGHHSFKLVKVVRKVFDVYVFTSIL